jgi:secreted PhoX family phosphatase
MRNAFSRRTFFRKSPAVLSTGLFGSLVARAESIHNGRNLTSEGYGPVRPAGDHLALPEGFQYSLISYEGEIMNDGFPVPSAMDGMACFSLPNGNWLLIRNHEDAETGERFRPRPATTTSTTAGMLVPVLNTHYGPRGFAYDRYAGGGTTSIEVDPRTRRRVREHWSLVGTLRNCAGGPTPWNSWLSGEETLLGATATGYDQSHGYLFEVPSTTSPGSPVQPVPLRQLGRFAHEAAAVDPDTGIVYETEDQGDVSGFYRFVPSTKPTKFGDLASATGELQMLRVTTEDGFVTCINQKVGTVYPVSWVRIANPDPAIPTATIRGVAGATVFQEGLNAGGAIFRRLEGCWYFEGKIYFTSTNGGDVGMGQIWVHDPKASTITLLYEAPHHHALDFPDNCAMSPRGGMVVCEDGTGGQRLMGLTPKGELFEFARNIFNSIELAGACFSPDGGTLFVNIYGRSTVRTASVYGQLEVLPIGSEEREKAMTLAIWGPWGTGLL